MEYRAEAWKNLGYLLSGLAAVVQAHESLVNKAGPERTLTMRIDLKVQYCAGQLVKVVLSRECFSGAYGWVVSPAKKVEHEVDLRQLDKYFNGGESSELNCRAEGFNGVVGRMLILVHKQLAGEVYGFDLRTVLTRCWYMPCGRSLADFDNRGALVNWFSTVSRTEEWLTKASRTAFSGKQLGEHLMKCFVLNNWNYPLGEIPESADFPKNGVGK